VRKLYGKSAAVTEFRQFPDRGTPSPWTPAGRRSPTPPSSGFPSRNRRPDRGPV